MSSAFLLLVAALAQAGGPATQWVGAVAPGEGHVVVEPDEVTAGLFYHGATLHVSAVVPEEAGVAFVCLGRSASLTLNRKGKALGLVWMNVGTVSWGQIPEVYLLRTSASLDRLASTAALDDLGVGFDAVRMGSVPGADADALFGELVKLKAREGLWGIFEGTVDVRAAEDGWALASADFALPPKASPGAYRIRVYAFRDGHGEVVGRGDVDVHQGGVPAFISGLAANHGLVYGVLAVAIAVAVGLLTGVVFGLGSKGGH